MSAQKGKRLALHDRLEQAIEALDLSKREFSQAMGKSQNWVPMALKHNQDLYATDLLRIEEIHGIRVTWLLYGQGRMKAAGSRK